MSIYRTIDLLVTDLPRFSCPQGQWECPSKERKCIDMKLVCNGVEDCPGGQDESPACGMFFC